MPGDDGFRFGHILIRDAAYDAIPKRQRAALHEHFADWLEERLGDDAPDEVVGYHLEQAYLLRSGARHAGSRLSETALRSGSLRLRVPRRARQDVAAAVNLLAPRGRARPRRRRRARCYSSGSARR